MLDDGQIYIVVDIEGDGPVPGLYSMLSLAAVAITEDEQVGTFYQKLKPLTEAQQDAETMAWWKTQPEAWQEVTTNPQPAEKVMKQFDAWVKSFKKTPVFVAQPVAYDYAYVSWYLWRFTGNNPFSDSKGASQTLDLTSFIAGKFGLSLLAARRANLPEWMKKGIPKHTHNALDDALGFSIILQNILKNRD